METDWAENRAGAPQGILAKYVGKYIEFLTDTYRRDKFRTRIERGSEPGTVEIYISHKGAAQVATKISQGAGEDYVWQPTPPNPELEAEFLSRLMVKFGTPLPAAATAMAALPQQPARARIEKGSDGANRLIVDDAFDRAWLLSSPNSCWMPGITEPMICTSKASSIQPSPRAMAMRVWVGLQEAASSRAAIWCAPFIGQGRASRP